MAGEIEAYQDALIALMGQEEAIQGMVEHIRAVSSDFHNGGWRTVLIRGVATPAELVVSQPVRSFDPGSWPSGQQISSTIARWHELHSTVRKAWERVPENRRVGLAPPPSRR